MVAGVGPSGAGAGTAGAVDFFVSYTAGDQRWAEWIAWQLEEAGYRTLIQAWDFGAGSQFVHQMHRAAGQARRTVVVLSPAYLRSAFAEAEWQAAWAADPLGQRRSLLVFRVEECDRLGLLRQVVSVDLFGLDERQAGVRVVAAASGERAKPASSPEFPGRAEPSGPRFPGQSGRAEAWRPGMAGGGASGKYRPLLDFLAGQAESVSEVARTFGEVEALVGPLPRSAWQHRAWWANDSKVQARAWRAAGWRVQSVDQSAGRVVFEREHDGRHGGAGLEMASRSASPAAGRRSAPLRAARRKSAADGHGQTGPVVRVFLCHSSQDKLATRDLCDRLVGVGYDVWFDERSLLPGQDFEYEIREAVKRCDIVIAVLSRNSVNKTGFVQKELRLALDAADERPEGATYLIPLRLDDAPVPPRLMKWHWLDATQSGWFERLQAALRAVASAADRSTVPARSSTPAQPVPLQSVPTAGDAATTFDVRRDGLFMLAEWSPARRLEPHRLVTRVTAERDRPRQTWIDEVAFADAVEETGKNSSGELVYFTGIRLDHRESEETQVCRAHLAESQYPEVLAIERLRIHRRELFSECDRVIAEDPRVYLRSAVPASIAVNVIPVAENLEVLCVERSAAVDSAVGWWTVGVFETMKRTDPGRPGSSEDMYSLAVRGLEEELGLRPPDFGEIMITWAGLYRPILRGHFVALTRLKIPREEVVARARAAHSGYEHAAFDWLPLQRSLVHSFINAPHQTCPDKVGATIHVGQKTYIEQSRLAILEVWRFRVLMDE
jgi:hypothetical protein